MLLGVLLVWFVYLLIKVFIDTNREINEKFIQEVAKIDALINDLKKV